VSIQAFAKIQAVFFSFASLLVLPWNIFLRGVGQKWPHTKAFVDVDTLSLCARYSGLTAELLLQRPSGYDYLARFVRPTGA